MTTYIDQQVFKDHLASGQAQDFEALEALVDHGQMLTTSQMDALVALGELTWPIVARPSETIKKLIITAFENGYEATETQKQSWASEQINDIARHANLQQIFSYLRGPEFSNNRKLDGIDSLLGDLPGQKKHFIEKLPRRLEMNESIIPTDPSKARLPLSNRPFGDSGLDGLVGREHAEVRPVELGPDHLADAGQVHRYDFHTGPNGLGADEFPPLKLYKDTGIDKGLGHLPLEEGTGDRLKEILSDFGFGDKTTSDSPTPPLAIDPPTLGD